MRSPRTRSTDRAAAKIPAWLVLCDGGLRCLRCGKSERMPVPMPTTAFTPWCEYQGALHAGCADTGRVDLVPTSVQEWIKSHDTGTSSRAIYRRMMGMPRIPDRAFGDYPQDPDDFGRCYRLLVLAPAWRARIGEMSDHGPEWAALARAWDELTVMYEAVLADGSPLAPQLYERMRELIAGARAPGETGAPGGPVSSPCEHEVVERHAGAPASPEDADSPAGVRNG